MLSHLTPQVLLCGPATVRSQVLRRVLVERGIPEQCIHWEAAPATERLREADLLICVLDQTSAALEVERAVTLLEQARQMHVSALVWGLPETVGFEQEGLIERVAGHVGLEEVVGRLTTLARYAPIIRRMEKELDQLQQLGNHLQRYFSEIDQELRLAGRLQQGFLPRELPHCERVRFARLYRPATWVSGDMYDVFRLDEQRVALFISDAMGHGTAAGLMSMFLRHSLVPTERTGDGTRIVGPAEVLTRLHSSLIEHESAHAQFVTAAYGVLDVVSGELCLSRAGHPYPLHIPAAGEISELRCEGGLLGVAGLDPDFEELRLTLSAGDKLILYTDGLEDTFIRERDEDGVAVEFGRELHELARLDADGLVEALAAYLDRQEGSLNPDDDVTLVVAEMR